MAPAIEVNATTATTAITTSSILQSTNSTSTITYSYYTTASTTPFYSDYDNPNWVQPDPDVYFYSGYAFYIVLVVFFIILLPFAIIMSALQRKRQEQARRLIEQRQRARRQMEISITNNNTNTGGGNGSVSIETENDVSILPKGMDLPPSYDELTYSTNVKQTGSLGASTLTITTDLGCSNANLAAFNEPPPDYVEPAACATTTTTTTPTVVVSGPAAMPQI
ncbi:uncharacterized protein LOC132793025 isoform X1 [Drosophila nasuta]|uniref:uncharacterized protein LOC132793025 isoform X1 n=1 Tax=Drosophila nasuta TaxID=42062 RepID=UPI00295E7CF4|nr:uncharacterized protein LOC132793025 isoform X1 [Drosophila nasuta]